MKQTQRQSSEAWKCETRLKVCRSICHRSVLSILDILTPALSSTECQFVRMVLLC